VLRPLKAATGGLTALTTTVSRVAIKTRNDQLPAARTVVQAGPVQRTAGENPPKSARRRSHAGGSNAAGSLAHASPCADPMA